MSNLFNKVLGFFGFGNPSISGPVVSGKKEGETTASYIPFTKGDTSPVLATESFAMPRAGVTLKSPFAINGVSDTNRVWVAKHTSGTGHKDASVDLGAGSQYIVVGGREYTVGSYRGIGFGYTSTSEHIAPVFIGMQETGKDDHTNGSFIVATRKSQKNEAPQVRLSITSDGQIRTPEDYVPREAQDLTTMKYVDYVIKSLQDQIDALKK